MPFQAIDHHNVANFLVAHNALLNIIDYSGRERASSQGAVWNVGGLAPLNGSAHGEQNRHFQRGTNARVFTASFSRRRVGSHHDIERYRGRIATALDIDCARKVLDFNQPTTIPQQPSGSRSPKGRGNAKAAWAGYRWEIDKENEDEKGRAARRNETHIRPAAFK